MEIVTLLIWLLILVVAGIILYRILALAPISPTVRAIIEIVILLIVLILIIRWLGPGVPGLWVRFLPMSGHVWALKAACWLLAAGCF
jgi:hypothetical protein